jgi:hypothetical protein
MGQSLAKTLAHKFKCHVNAIWKRYGATLPTPHGPRAGLRVVVGRGSGKKPWVAHGGGLS